MRTWKKQHRYVGSLLAGLLMVLAFPFIGSLPLLMCVALVPLLMVEDQVSSANYRSNKVFIHAYLTFLIYNVGTTWWIWNASPGGAIFAFTLNALIMALVFQLFHMTKKKLGSTLGYAAFILFWMSFETIHYTWELSWPWLNLGNVFAISPKLVQWYAYTGVLGGTLWLLLLNLLFFLIIKKAWIEKRKLSDLRKLLILIVLTLTVPIAISNYEYGNYELGKGKLAGVVVTQPNIDPYNEKFMGNVHDQLDKICDLADRHVSEETEFVLAPETALPFSFYEDEIQRIIYYPYLVERKAKWGKSSLLIGASTKKYFKYKRSRASKEIYGGPGYEEFYNSSLLIDEYDHPSFVHKSKLVLGVEKVPFSNWLPFLEALSINSGGTSGTLGIEDESQVMKSKGITFAPIICYESIYGDFVAEQCRKGAELLFIITNDGWWGDTPGYKQHQAFASLRAIECRKYLARSANTGSSCFINPRGDISQATAWWEQASIKGQLFRNNEQTFYVRMGNYLGRISILGALFLLGFTAYKILRKKQVKAHGTA